MFILLYLYFNYSYVDMTYIKSTINGNYYLVRNNKDKQHASNMLAKIFLKIKELSQYLYNNVDKYDEYKEYIYMLHNKVDNIILIESTASSEHTSYSVNKGERIIFCLRTKNVSNDLHDLNLIMYVVLHELSHVACPIYDNHGPLFRKIFAFFVKNAIDIGLYTKIDFNGYPVEYCGMSIHDSII